MAANYRSVVSKHQALIDSEALSLLLLRIEEASLDACASQQID
jgi:hypothetical protein